MAIVRTPDGSKRSGKLNKQSKEIHRVRNGREHVYSIEKPYKGPPSDAQKLQRSIFGKANAMVNTIMADPLQVEQWKARMEAYNHSINPVAPPFPKRFKTVRQFVYATISEQLKHKPAVKRRKSKLPISLPRGVKLHINAFSDLSAAEIYEILKARFNVFVCEQHIHYLDEDNIDYLATHFSLRRNGLVIAYARLFPDAEPGVMRIGRMLTLERNKGYAKYLLAQIANEAANQGATILRLHAQMQAVPFYEKMGFHPLRDIFVEAEIPHICMEKNV